MLDDFEAGIPQMRQVSKNGAKSYDDYSYDLSSMIIMDEVLFQGQDCAI